MARSRFEPRRGRPRGSVLDPFKPRITRLLDTHPYSAQQILQRLREEGYGGGMILFIATADGAAALLRVKPWDPAGWGLAILFAAVVDTTPAK